MPPVHCFRELCHLTSMWIVAVLRALQLVVRNCLALWNAKSAVQAALVQMGQRSMQRDVVHRFLFVICHYMPAIGDAAAAPEPAAGGAAAPAAGAALAGEPGSLVSSPGFGVPIVAIE